MSEFTVEVGGATGNEGRIMSKWNAERQARFSSVALQAINPGTG
jgi:hypothetical protein